MCNNFLKDLSRNSSKDFFENLGRNVPKILLEVILREFLEDQKKNIRDFFSMLNPEISYCEITPNNLPVITIEIFKIFLRELFQEFLQQICQGLYRDFPMNSSKNY